MAEVALRDGLAPRDRLHRLHGGGQDAGRARRRRAARAGGDRHRRAARGGARRADRDVLRARGRGGVPAPRGAPGRLGARRARRAGRRASSVVALGGGAVESLGVRRALAEHMPVWCDGRRGGRLGTGLGLGPAPGRGSRPSSPSATPAAGRSTSRSPARSCPRTPGTAAGAGRPLAGGDAGRRPACAWRGPQSESGAYPAVVGEGAVGLLDDAREALPEDLPARTFCVADDEAPAPPPPPAPAAAR